MVKTTQTSLFLLPFSLLFLDFLEKAKRFLFLKNPKNQNNTVKITPRRKKFLPSLCLSLLLEEKDREKKNSLGKGARARKETMAGAMVRVREEGRPEDRSRRRTRKPPLVPRKPYQPRALLEAAEAGNL